MVHPREPRLIQKIWTTQEFSSNFTLKAGFRAAPMPTAASIFAGHRLQCRDYLVAGPCQNFGSNTNRRWNGEIIVAVTNNVAFCTCNG